MNLGMFREIQSELCHAVECGILCSSTTPSPFNSHYFKEKNTVYSKHSFHYGPFP